MKRVSLLLAILGFLGLQVVFAQTREISGVVTSAQDRSTIPGASVFVKGTTLGTVTGNDGSFTLRIPESAKTLAVSFIGMTSAEVPVTSASTYKIALKVAPVEMGEVVVTAMGIKRSEKSLGYSAATVNNEQLTLTGNSSAINALEGKIAGVNVSSASGAPGASTRVVLRGISSLGGSNQPLYVVDGVPINNSMAGSSTDINGGLDFGNRANDINPNDIESITVLKGGSASVMYGSRAANGVIMIITKKGASSTQGKAKIEFSNATTFETPLRLPLMQNEFGQGWYDGTLEANLEENGSWGPKFDGVNRVWGHIVDNQQMYKPYVALPNNVKDFFDVGLNNNSTISISNGNDRQSYYLSYGNVYNDGIMPTTADSYQRHSLSLRGSSKFGEKWNVSGSLNYIRKNDKFVPTGQEQTPLDALWQTPRDISIVDMKDYNNKFNNVDNYYTVYAQNPYYVLNEHGNKMEDNRIFGNVSIDYEVLPWLTASWVVGSDVSNATLKQWRAITLSNRANYNDEVGRVEESSYMNSELNSELQLKVKKTWNDFALSGLVGQSVNQRNYRGQFSEVIGLDLPNFYNLSNSASTPTATERVTQRRIVGLYGSFDLAWKEMLFLNVTGRNDWSSTLPASNRSFFYPGASLSFLFSELLGSNSKDFLSYGKIRAGVSQTGKDTDPYQINSIFPKTVITDGYRDLSFPLAGPINGFTMSNRLGNPFLKPEITSEAEIGTELKFLQNRVGVDFTYYNRTSTNLIWDVTLPSSSGFTTQTQNLGKITNKGVELQINAVPVRTKDLEWSLTWNYAKNNNLLVDLIPGLDQISLGAGTSTLGFVARPGMPVGLFEGLIPMTTEDGRPVVNSSGLPLSAPDRAILGDSNYDYTMGALSDLRYKNWSLHVAFDFRKGGFFYSRTSEMMYFTGNAPQTTYNDRQPWIIPNSVQNIGTSDNPKYVENTVPISGADGNLNLYYNQDYSAGKFGYLNLLDKTFVKWRELSVSYNFPSKLFSRTPISGASLSVIGRNLMLWTPKSNIFADPESTTWGDENGLGANYGEYGAMPSTRSIGFSLKLTL